MKKVMIAVLSALVLISCEKERMLNEPGNLVPKTVDQDASLPSINVNGALLHSEAFGPAGGTMVIVIHGGPGSDYRSLLTTKSLADLGYRVVFYDQRGSGLSQRFPHDSYTSMGIGAVDLMYDELTGVIAHYRTKPDQKVYLIGHSWGGIMAAGYAGKYPDAIDGLVVAEPGGLKWNDIEEYVKESRSFNLWGEMLNDATYLDQFISGKEDQHEILDYKAGMIGSTNEITGDDVINPESAWRAGATINAAMFEVGDKYHPDFSVGLNSFDIPVLFIYSEKNKAYGDDWARHIGSAFIDVQYHKAYGTGHEGIFSDNNVWNNSTGPAVISYFNSL